MSEEPARLAPEIVIVGIICASLVAVVVAVQWSRVRRQECELDLTRHLIDRGLTLDEITRLLAEREPSPKGVLEQFGELSRGTRFGLGFLAFIAMALTMAVAQSYIFWVARK